ncbi:hypothetical protein [Prochlorothrix hollandica]|uniref:hypothetical protein n=1 Tax=Prochlorothrix hollandica TaxID=1223 RepID=UPI003342BA29
MNRSAKTSESIPIQTIVIISITWAIVALFFYMLFGVRAEGEARPLWYSICTYIFENVGYMAASLLCFRNWQSRQMVSGRRVWLLLGLAMFFFFVGNLFFGIGELVFQLDADVSLGDIFYIPCYGFLAWGMILAVIPRRLNMELWQWAVLGAVAMVGIVVTYGLVTYADNTAELMLAANPVVPDGTEPEISNAPAWALSLNAMLLPFANLVSQIYIVGDVALLIAASTLLLAFWGGRFAQSWRMIAAAMFCFYISDMWYYYAVNTNPDYQSGELLEVGWVFSAVLVAIGAALEYDISTKSRRGSGSRRRGGAS